MDEQPRIALPADAVSLTRSQDLRVSLRLGPWRTDRPLSEASGLAVARLRIRTDAVPASSRGGR